MTESRTFANPLTAEGRSRLRANWRTGREVVNRYPGSGASSRVTFMLWLVIFVGFRPEGDFWLALLFGLVAVIALLPLEIALSTLFAGAAHVRFGIARAVGLFAATMVSATGIGVSRKALALDPAIARVAVAGFFAVFTWSAVLLCASYLRQGRATPAPEAGAFEDMARGRLSLAMGGAIAAGFTLVAILLAAWIAL